MTKVERAKAGLAWCALFGAATTVIAWASAGLLAVFIGGVAATMTLMLAKRASDGSPASTFASAFAAGTLPLWVYKEGEAGLMWGVTTAVVVVGLSCLAAKGSPGAVSRAGVLIWLPCYVGLGLSYVVLVRHQEPGQRLLLCVTLILIAIKASGLAESRITSKGDQRRGSPLSGPAAAVAAAEVAAMLSLMFLQAPFGPGSLATLGLITALGAVLGEASGRMIARDLSGGEPVLPAYYALDAWLVALPVFFYGFRLYLT